MYFLLFNIKLIFNISIINTIKSRLYRVLIILIKITYK
jgi:hypothetical protein